MDRVRVRVRVKHRIRVSIHTVLPKLIAACLPPFVFHVPTATLIVTVSQNSSLRCAMD